MVSQLVRRLLGTITGACGRVVVVWSLTVRLAADDPASVLDGLRVVDFLEADVVANDLGRAS